MRALLDRLANPLHLLIALATLWLLATSAWLGMYRRVPDPAGWINASHIALGFAALALGAVYTLACTLGGRWRLYFPWLGGQGAAVLRDLAGLARGQRPMSEGGGLFGAIEGLLLLALLAAGLTGALWFAQQGSESALAWRSAHVMAAWSFAGLLIAHVISVSLHLVDLIRN
jgi:cytochrome b561